MAFIDNHIGEMAALGAASFWVVTSLSFAAAGRRIGPTAVNLIRILLALTLMAILHRLLMGFWIPQPDQRGLMLLAASGLIGLSLGDQFLYTALVEAGPRVATLIMTCVPPIAALLAWPVLGESLRWLDLMGMALTLGGIGWVVMERKGRPTAGASRPIRGAWFALLGATGQATGLVLGKLGIGHTRMADGEHLDSLSAALTRLAFGAVGIIAIALLLRRKTMSAPISRRTLAAALALTVLGTIFGPVMGMWSSLVAIDHASTGVAATLMAMTPVFILPFAVIVEKEPVTPRAVIGAVTAVAGVALLAM